jgi:hypothetical protein
MRWRTLAKNPMAAPSNSADPPSSPHKNEANQSGMLLRSYVIEVLVAARRFEQPINGFSKPLLCPSALRGDFAGAKA